MRVRGSEAGLPGVLSSATQVLRHLRWHCFQPLELVAPSAHPGDIRREETHAFQIDVDLFAGRIDHRAADPGSPP